MTMLGKRAIAMPGSVRAIPDDQRPQLQPPPRPALLINSIDATWVRLLGSECSPAGYLPSGLTVPGYPGGRGCVPGSPDVPGSPGYPWISRDIPGVPGVPGCGGRAGGQRRRRGGNRRNVGIDTVRTGAL